MGYVRLAVRDESPHFLLGGRGSCLALHGVSYWKSATFFPCKRRLIGYRSTIPFRAPVLEDNLCVIYHSLENARVYHAEAPQKLEFPLECYDAIEYALNSWPKYVVVGDAPGIADDPELLDVIVALYDAGLLMRRRTL
jgi:hypothetical protein